MHLQRSEFVAIACSGEISASRSSRGSSWREAEGYSEGKSWCGFVHKHGESLSSWAWDQSPGCTAPGPLRGPLTSKKYQECAWPIVTATLRLLRVLGEHCLFTSKSCSVAHESLSSSISPKSNEIQRRTLYFVCMLTQTVYCKLSHTLWIICGKIFHRCESDASAKHLAWKSQLPKPCGLRRPPWQPSIHWNKVLQSYVPNW